LSDWPPDLSLLFEVMVMSPMVGLRNHPVQHWLHR